MVRAGKTNRPQSAGQRPTWFRPHARGRGVAKVVSDPVSSVTSVIGKQVSDQPVGFNEVPEPYGLKGLHVVGPITMKGETVYVLAVSQNEM